MKIKVKGIKQKYHGVRFTCTWNHNGQFDGVYIIEYDPEKGEYLNYREKDFADKEYTPENKIEEAFAKGVWTIIK